MRPLLPLALLAPAFALAGCDGGKDDSQPGIVTNILDDALPNAQQPPPPDNAIVPAEPLPDIPQPEDSAESSIPAPLLGRWTGAAETCGDRAAALELTVTPDRLIFHESEGRVTAVKGQEDGRVRVIADFTGEGESWTRTLEMKPSADGRRLTIVNDGASVTRKRCS